MKNKREQRNRRSLWERVLTMLLCMAMLITSTPVQSLAQETEAVTETPAPETAAQTQSQPETTAQTETQPVTAAPTEAPQTTTTVPAETSQQTAATPSETLTSETTQKTESTITEAIEAEEKEIPASSELATGAGETTPTGSEAAVDAVKEAITDTDETKETETEETVSEKEETETEETEEILTDLTFQVLWEDEQNTYGVRPEPKFILYADGQKLAESRYTVRLVKAEANLATYEIQDLPAGTETAPIVYTLQEKEIVGYKTMLRTLLNDSLQNAKEPEARLTFDIDNAETAYKAEKRIENTLELWTVSGTIIWDTADGELERPENLPDLLSVTTANGAAYGAYQASYTAEKVSTGAEDKSTDRITEEILSDTAEEAVNESGEAESGAEIWNYTVTLPAISHKGAKQIEMYTISFNTFAGCTVEGGMVDGLTVTGSLDAPETVVRTVEAESESESESETGTEYETGTEIETEIETETVTEAESVDEEISLWSAVRRAAATTVAESNGSAGVSIQWLDNYSSARPSAETLTELFTLSYTLGGTTALLTPAVLSSWGFNVGELGLTVQSTAGELLEKLLTGTNSGTSVVNYNVSGLPSVIFMAGETETGVEVSYSLAVSETETPTGYIRTTDASGNVYYILTTDFTSTVAYKVGNTDLTEFQPTGFTLYQRIAGETDTKPAEVDLKDCWAKNEDGSWLLTVPSLPLYTTENQDIIYSLHFDGDEDNVPGVDQDSQDSFKIEYDNAASPNHGTDISTGYDQGTIIITRTGVTDYTATKEWQDDGTPDTIANRPSGTLRLMRYTENGENDYTTAARVMNGGKDVTAFLDTDPKDVTGKSVNSYVIEFMEAGAAISLEKYDPEGYPYVYLVWESLENDDYEQYIYDEEGTLQQEDPSVYNKGKILNRRTGTVREKVRKEWYAAAEQETLSGTEVTLELQRSLKGGDSSSREWETVDTVIMSSFSKVFTTDEYEGLYPQYDDAGLEYEYRWVETGVAYNEEALKLTQDPEDPDKNTFIMNGETYESVQTTGTDGVTTITNRLVGSTDYHIVKKWYENGQQTAGPSDGRLSVSLYSGILNDEGEICLTAKQIVLTAEAGSAATAEVNGGTVTITNHGQQEDLSWTLDISGLPAYDEWGYRYTYEAREGTLETAETDWSLDYFTYSRDEEGHSVATFVNTKGEGEIIRIPVRKRWQDDGDERLRGNVTVGAYYTDQEGNEKELGTVELTADENWFGWISFRKPEDLKDPEKDISIKEAAITIGGTAYRPGNSFTRTDGSIQALGEDQIATAANVYEITYSQEESSILGSSYGWIWTVTNTRIGFVDYSATKIWQDEGNSADNRPDAVLVLSCDSSEYLSKDAVSTGDGYYTAEQIIYTNPYTKETVTISTKQEVRKDFSVEAGVKETYTFINLPKYDSSGKVIHYRVTEQWMDAESAQTWDYAITYAASAYRYGGHDHNDSQSVTVNNIRTETVNPQFHKIWSDVWAYNNGNRPDIYLRLYRWNPDSNKMEYVGYRPYVWSADESAIAESCAADTTLDREEAAKYMWTCTFYGLPKYDDKGREIQYFAEEHMSVDAAAFDYVDTQYYASFGDVESQKEYASMEEYSKAGLIPVGGYFFNRLEKNITITGIKKWLNLPSGFPAAELPDITFVLSRSIKSDNISEGTEDTDFTEVRHQFDYEEDAVSWNTFSFLFDKDTVGQPLPKYNTKGMLYSYTVEEEFDKQSTEQISIYKDPVVNSYTITNEFLNLTGALTVTKTWDRSKLTDEDTAEYPKAVYTLYRRYSLSKTDSQTAAYSQWEKLDSKTIDSSVFADGASSNDQVLFEGLLIYAPNKQKYEYKVVEAAINGYDTSAVYSSDAQTVESVDSETVEGIRFTVTKDGENSKVSSEKVAYTNTYIVPTEKIMLTGVKNWEDYNDALNLRPSALIPNNDIVLSRYADAQAGQDNEIVEAVVELQTTLDSEENYFNWKYDAGANQWSYTVTNLERYAPNGTEWKYRITEKEREAYNDNKSLTVTQSSSAADRAGSVTVTMQPLNNVLTYTEATVKKEWPNLNSYVRPYMRVYVKLQVLNNNVWEDVASAFGEDFPSAYAKLNSKSTEYAFSETLSNANQWIVTLTKLPAGYYNSSNIWMEYQYRFVETSIVETVGSADKTTEVSVKDMDGTEISYKENAVYKITGNVDGTTTTINNTLNNITSLEITKKWSGDDIAKENYLTREKIRIKVQRKLVGEENTAFVDVAGLVWNWDGETKLTGIDQLPKYAPDGTAYVYRVVEISRNGDNSNTAVQVIGPDGDGRYIFVTSQGYCYNITYDNPTDAEVTEGIANDTDDAYTLSVDNKMETVDIAARKQWVSYDGDYTLSSSTIYGEGKTVVLEIKRKDGIPFTKPVTVELDGKADANTSGNCESSAWTASFKGLPKYTYNSTLKIVEEIEYIVEEVTVSTENGKTVTKSSNADGFWKVEMAVSGESEKTAAVKNIFTRFSLDKIDSDTNASITKRDVTLAVYAEDEITKLLTWQRTAYYEDGVFVEYEEKVTPNKENAPTVATSASTDSAASVVGLPLGTYILREEDVPDGYEKAADIKFTLTTTEKDKLLCLITGTGNDAVTQTVTYDAETGKVSNSLKLTMADKKISLKLKKYDSDTESEISEPETGYAMFTVKGKFADGETEKTNITSANISRLDGLWIAGETYTFTETTAPDGYKLYADKNAVSVKIDPDGSGKITAVSGEDNANATTDAKDKNGETLIIYNDPIKITLKKADALTDGNALTGAKFTLIDETLKEQKKSEAEYSRDVTVGTDGLVLLTGTDASVAMVQGHTYTLSETKAPEGYRLLASMPELTFQVDEYGKVAFVTNDNSEVKDWYGLDENQVTITVKNDPVEVKLQKADMEEKTAYLNGAVFTLSKLENETPVVIAEGLTTKEDSGNDGILTLRTGEKDKKGRTYTLTTETWYILTETEAPAGYELVKPIRFYIKEDGSVSASGDTAPDFSDGTEGIDDYVDLVSTADTVSTLTVYNRKTEFTLNKQGLDVRASTKTGDKAEDAEDLHSVTLRVYSVDGAGTEVLVFTWKRTKAEGVAAAEVVVDCNSKNSLADTVSYNRETDVISGLPEGDYVLREVPAETPEEYLSIPDCYFTMKPDGTLIFTDNASGERSAEQKLSDETTNQFLIPDTDGDGIPTLTAIDERIRSDVMLTKYLEEEAGNQTLEGVIFDLYLQKGNSPDYMTETPADIRVAAGLTTDRNGGMTLSTQTMDNGAGLLIPMTFIGGTDEGKRVSIGLSAGKYYLVETGATADSVLDPTPVKFEIKRDDTTGSSSTVQPEAVTCKKKNSAFTADVVFYKTDTDAADDDEKYVEGAAFKLEYTPDTPIGLAENEGYGINDAGNTRVYRSDSNGKVVLNGLKKGTYQLYEISNPGYMESGADPVWIAEFVITEEHNNKTGDEVVKLSEVVSATPEPVNAYSKTANELGNGRIRGSVTLTKKDAGDETKLLDGTEFQLQVKDISNNSYSEYLTTSTALVVGRAYDITIDRTENTVTAAEQPESSWETGKLKITGIDWGTYRLVETKAKDGYSPMAETADSVSGEKNVRTEDFKVGRNTKKTFAYTRDNHKTSLQLVKQSMTGEVLAGAEFAIEGTYVNASGIRVEKGTVGSVEAPALTGVSDANGIVNFDGNLIVGETYRLTETKAPEHYTRIQTAFIFMVTEDGSIAKVYSADTKNIRPGFQLAVSGAFYNRIRVSDEMISVSVKKVSSVLVVDGPPKVLEGAEFTLTDLGLTGEEAQTKDEIIAEKLTTGGDGIAELRNAEGVSLLIYGHTYTLEETKAPDGYILPVDDDGRYPYVTFSVNDRGLIETWNSSNREKYRRATEADDPLIEFCFENDPIRLFLGKEDYTIVQEIQEIIDNQLSEKLPDPTLADVGFTLKEVISEDGAITDEKIVAENIKTDEHGCIEYADALLIQGHIYRLYEHRYPGYQEDGAEADGSKLVFQFRVLDNGHIEKSEEFGFKDAAGADVTVDFAEEDSKGNTINQAMIIIDNKRIPGTIHITKTDSDHSDIDGNDLPLAGVEFTLYKKNSADTSGAGYVYTDADKVTDTFDGTAVTTGNRMGNPAVTDAEGTASFTDLPWGSYVLMETATVAGYEIPEVHSWEITIGSNGTTVSVLSNQSISNQQNRISFQKYYDENTSLSGAVFELTPVAGSRFADTRMTRATGFDRAFKAFYTEQDGQSAGAGTLTWTSVADEPFTLQGWLIAGQSYKLTEAKAPDGYEKNEIEFVFTVQADGTVEWTGNAPGDTAVITKPMDDTKNRQINVYDKLISLQILKQDSDSADKLNGAVFKLEKQIITDGTGTYEAVPGMDNLTTANVDGKDGVISIQNETDHIILVQNTTYRLTETKAPENYRLEKDASERDVFVEFTVEEDGTVTFLNADSNEFISGTAALIAGTGIDSITVKNEKTRLSVLKLDNETGQPLADVQLAIYRLEDFNLETGEPNSGTTMAVTWITGQPGDTDGVHVLEGILNACPQSGKTGTDYVLYEAETPTGYDSFEPVVFRLNTDNSITLAEDMNGRTDVALAENPTDSGDYRITVTNTRIRGHVKLTKTVEEAAIEVDGQAVTVGTTEGTVFSLYRVVGHLDDGRNQETDDVQIASGLTIKDGIWTSEGNSADHFLAGAGDDFMAVNEDGNRTEEPLPLSCGLVTGTYYFKEAQATPDAVLDTASVYAFTIGDSDTGAHGRVVDETEPGEALKAVNEPFAAAVTLTKLDEELLAKGATNPGISDAEFKLSYIPEHGTAEDQVTLPTQKTDAEGRLTFTNLPKGDYTLEEIAAEGYDINQTHDESHLPFKATFTISESNNALAKNGDAYEMDEKCYIVMNSSLDGNSGNNINGDTDGNSGNSLNSDPDSNGSGSGLDNGPDENGEIAKVTLQSGSWTEEGITNARLYGSVTLYKMDADAPEVGLNGTVFTLQRKAEAETGTDGGTDSGTDGGTDSGADNGTDGGAADGAFEDFLTGLEVGKVYQAVTAADGTVSVVPVGTAANGELTVKDLDWGTYRFVETKAKDGYTCYERKNGQDGTAELAVVTSDEFTISRYSNKANAFDTDRQGSDFRYMLYNHRIRLTLTKQSLSGRLQLAGAEFAIEGTYVDTTGDTPKLVEHGTIGSTEAPALTGISNENGELIFDGNLIAGETYTLTETKAPDYYERIQEPLTFTVAEDGSIAFRSSRETGPGFWLAATGYEENHIVASDEAIVASVRKISSAEDEVLAGAVFKLTDRGADPEDTADDTLLAESLTTGEDGIVWLEYDEDKDGDGEMDPILIYGHSYTLEEIKAPVGYILPEEHPTLNFSVDDEGMLHFEAGSLTESGVITGDGTTEICVTNDPMSVTLVKYDKLDGVTVLAGSVFDLYRVNEEGEETLLKSGLTTDEKGSLTFTGTKAQRLLEYDTVYRLTETKATPGYELAASFTFTLGENGTISSVSDTETASFEADSNVLKVYDTPTLVTIRKTDADTGAALAGAKLMLLDEDGERVATWTSTAEPYVIQGQMVGGATYELVEIAAPEGYQKAENVSFTVPERGGEVQVVMEDSKVPTSDYGSITVTKYTSYQGNPLNISETYYAALFADEAYTNRISSVQEIRLTDTYAASVVFDHLPYGTYYVAETDEYGNVVEGDSLFAASVTDARCVLTANGHSGHSRIENAYLELPPGAYYIGDGSIEVEKQLTDGKKLVTADDLTFYVALFMDEDCTYQVSETKQLRLRNASSATVTFDHLVDGTYYLAETDENGVPVVSGENGFDYEINMPERVFAISSGTQQYEVTFQNITDPVSETEKTTESETETKTTNKSVKTGDDTPIGLYVLLLMLSGMAGAFWYDRRRRRTVK